MATGELTQRIGEVVFDGSEDEVWIQDFYTTGDESTRMYAKFKTPIENIIDYDLINHGLLCDKLTQATGGQLWGKDIGGVGGSLGHIKINVLKSSLTSFDVLGIRSWLQANPITIQYKLATPTIKTVDLSDNHVYSYKDTTHYSFILLRQKTIH